MSKSLREIAPGVLQWSVHLEEKAIDLNGTLVVDAGGNVAIDPPILDAGQIEEVERLGGVAHVVLTNRHHVRETARLVERTGARVWVPLEDAGGDVGGLDVAVAEAFRAGDGLPAGLVAIGVADSKTPGETALLLPRDGGTLILGDALIGKPAGRLSLLPAPKIADPAKAAEGLRPLLEHDFVRVVVGDGANPEDGRRAFEAFLAEHDLAPEA